MIVLQSLWENSKGLHLWAESSELFSGTSRGRKKVRQEDVHNFVLPYSALVDLASEISEHWDSHSVQPGQLKVLLPSTEKGPIPSDERLGSSIDELILSGQKIKLRPWQIETLFFDPGIVLEYLTTLKKHPDSLILGNSLRFWTEAAKLALEMVARESILPGFNSEEREGNRYSEATWEALLEGESQERLKLLGDSMPPCCRAIQYSGKEAPSPGVLIRNFLNRTINGFIHKNLAEEVNRTDKLKSPKMASITGNWLKALASAKNQIKASESDATKFLQELDSWLSQVKFTPAETALRASFRLEPPENQDEEWHLAFNLQASADRSLLIPADKIWRTRSGVITLLKQRFENPQERLLADLGKASRIFPPIEESLKNACPMGVKLHSENAYQFLREYACLLEQSGFGVLLPAWWQKPELRLGSKLKLKPKTGTKQTGSGLLGLDSIVAYEWEIALGETVLSREEFEQLAGLKVPLVKIRGQWIELNPEEIKKTLTFFKKAKEGEMRLGEALRTGLGQGISETGLPVTGVESEGWIKYLLDTFSGDKARIPFIQPPSSFKGQLRPYQVSGISWLAFLRQFGLGACLADDMGLGKTIEFISFLLYLQDKKQLKGPSLLVCPMSVVNNWKSEVERFAPSLKIMIHHGPNRDTGDNLVQKAKKQDIVVTTYSLVQRDAGYLSKIKWECLALDEAQNIKNPSAKQSQTVRKLESYYRVALTGTPVENRLSELWSIMDFLNPGYLKSAQDFQTQFVTPIEKYHNPIHTERLKQLINPFILRRVKTDKNIINDLPEKIETNVFCNLTQEQATLYEAIVKEMIEKIDNSEGIERKGLVLSTLLKLKQICNHPSQFLQDHSPLPGRSGKFTRLEEILEEVVAEGDKALIFTQFAEMGKMLKQHLQEKFGCEVLFLYGSTPRKERDIMIRRFQENHRGSSLFILSLKAGGTGLNLTAANHVFHFDRWWNPAVENQATDRAFRIGQKKNVQVHKFICLGTLEERIDEMIEQKRNLSQNIIGSGEAWLTEMSTDQLKKVLKLSRETVEA